MRLVRVDLEVGWGNALANLSAPGAIWVFAHARDVRCVMQLERVDAHLHAARITGLKHILY